MYLHSFRIKKAMAINMQQDVNKEQMIIIYKGIICAIDIHRKATESVHILQYLYNMLY